jgi:hypothetical protein
MSVENFNREYYIVISPRDRAICELKKSEMVSRHTLDWNSYVASIDNCTGNFIIYYISFRTINLKLFLSYSFPGLHVIN